MAETLSSKKRYAYLDFLRILAAFLVIVNHTNSLVFEKLSPDNLTWWFSLGWYYLSKIAVPLFVMVSGACLLPRRDTPRQSWWRFLRVLLVLVLFSYGYYLADLWETNWTWARALDFPGFLLSIWEKRITDSFWYLYFYLGLMVILPVLQRLATAMSKQDIRYLLTISFGFSAAWPLGVHYLPALALPQYFELPLFSVFLGLFFAGHYLHTYAGHSGRFLPALVTAATVAASLWLTRLEYGRVSEGAKYWFMDERTAPSILVIFCAMAVMLWAREAFTVREKRAEHMDRGWAVLGACSFGIYLLQDLVIAQTRYRFFVPVSGAINPLLAAVLWELGVFGIALAVAWVLKHIPLLRRLL